MHNKDIKRKSYMSKNKISIKSNFMKIKYDEK